MECADGKHIQIYDGRIDKRYFFSFYFCLVREGVADHSGVIDHFLQHGDQYSRGFFATSLDSEISALGNAEG